MTKSALPKLPSITSAGKTRKPQSLKIQDLKRSDPEPDPLEKVNYTGNTEEDAKAELNALQQGFKDRAKNEAQRFKQATDTEYWFAVCFSSREEKESFLKAIGLGKRGDPDKYLVGRQLAALLGIEY